MTGFSFTGQWYIEPQFAERMRALIGPRLEAGKDPIPANLLTLNPTIDAKLSRDEQWVADYFRQADGVAVIPINGAMSRSGDYCGYGNETLMAWLNILSRDEHTVAAVLKINSPGGTVDSTRAFADTVRNFGKPIVAWTPYCASAAYYVASQCTEIVVEEQLVDAVGSIGVLMVLVDRSEALKKQGIGVQIIRADGSEDKALVNEAELVSAETMAELKATLNACRAEFVGYVRRGRAGKVTSDEVFSGKMYAAKDAIRLGLADRLGSLAVAQKRALQLAKS